jgi:hypothetical protein
MYSKFPLVSHIYEKQQSVYSEFIPTIKTENFVILKWQIVFNNL